MRYRIKITKQVRSVGAIMVENFADNRIEMIQLAIDADNPHSDRPLYDISQEFLLGKGIGIAGILREEPLRSLQAAPVNRQSDRVLLLGGESMDTVEGLFSGKNAKAFGAPRHVGWRRDRIFRCARIGGTRIDVVLIEHERASRRPIGGLPRYYDPERRWN